MSDGRANPPTARTCPAAAAPAGIEPVDQQVQRWSLWLLGIFLLALALRLLHIFLIRDEVFFDILMGDGEFFYQWAAELRTDGWLWREQTFYQAPLYPYWLALVSTIVGDDLLNLRIVQAVVGSATCVLMALAGRAWFGSRAGIVAGMLLALYAPAIYFDALIQKAVLSVFLLALVLYLLGRLRTPGRPIARLLGWWGVGLALAALVLTRENAAVFVPAVLAWLWIGYRGECWKRRTLWSAMFVVGLACLLVPVAARNQVMGGGFHLTTSNFGHNFYIGNGAPADGSYVPLRRERGEPRFERADAIDIAQQETGRQLTDQEVSAYWTRRALGDIRAQPLRWLRVLAQKFVLIFTYVELGDTDDFYMQRAASPVLAWTSWVMNFGVLATLAAAGTVLAWPHRRRLWLWWVMIALYVAGVMAFFVFARFRYVLVPLMLPFAAVALLRAWQWWRGGSDLAPHGRMSTARKIAWAAVVVWGVFVCWPFDRSWTTLSKQHMHATAHYNLGNELLDRDQTRAAARQYQRAIALAGDHAQAHNNLAMLYVAAGENDQAMRHLQRAVALDPSYQTAVRNLAQLHAREERLTEAAVWYRRAVDAEPQDTPLRLQYAAALVATRDMSAAADEYRLALEQMADDDPHRDEVARRFIAASLAAGRGTEALPWLRRQVAARPTAAGFVQLGHALLQQGDVDEAAAAFERALQLDATQAQARVGLAQALALQGDYARAIALLDRLERSARAGPTARQLLAWLLATTPNESLRDPARAVELASALVREAPQPSPRLLDTLAVALASAGQFEQAEAMAQRAVELLPPGEQAMRNVIERRLEQFRAGEPYVEDNAR